MNWPKKLPETLAIALLLGFLASCSEPPGRSVSLTAEELLQALEGELFEVKLPTDLKETDQIGISFRPAGKEPRSSGSFSGGLVPGEVVKVILFHPVDETCRYSILSRNGRFSGNVRVGPHQNFAINSERKGILTGDWLLRTSRDPSVVIGGEPGQDDGDIVLQRLSK